MGLLARSLPRLALLAGLACSDRDHLNPLDPENPATGGEPWELRAVAGDREVEVRWETFDFDDLAGFDLERAAQAGPDSAIARLDARAASYRDSTVENGQDYSYRLVPILDGERRLAATGPVAATPGPQVVWVADTGGFQVARVAPDGREVVFRRSGFRAPNSVSVSPVDGRVWVADSFNGRVVALDLAGTIVLDVRGFSVPKAVSASPADGGVWVADERRGEIVRLASTGTVLARVGGLLGPADVAVNPADGSCWAADAARGEVLLIAPDSTIATRAGGFGEPLQLAAVPGDRSVWVADDERDEVVHIAADGGVLGRIGPVERPFGLAVEPATGEVWVGSFGAGTVERYTADGELVLRVSGFAAPLGLARDPVDGGLWVVESQRGQVAKLTAGGTVVARTSGYSLPYDIDVGPGSAGGEPWGPARMVPSFRVDRVIESWSLCRMSRPFRPWRIESGR